MTKAERATKNAGKQKENQRGHKTYTPTNCMCKRPAHTHTQREGACGVGAMADNNETTTRDAKAKAKGGQDVMTIKTNANCKLLAKCSRPFPRLPVLSSCPTAGKGRTAHAMAATAACCIFLQSLFVHGHKLRAGRPALATYYDQFGAAHTQAQAHSPAHTHTHKNKPAHTLVQHSHTKRSRHCVEARANTLLLLYLVGAGAQQTLQAAARRLVSLLSLLLLLLLLTRPTSCGRARLAWVASQSTHTNTHAGRHARTTTCGS